jgi:hypothetical protein
MSILKRLRVFRKYFHDFQFAYEVNQFLVGIRGTHSPCCGHASEHRDVLLTESTRETGKGRLQCLDEM